jgi:hypothetical protein
VGVGVGAGTVAGVGISLTSTEVGRGGGGGAAWRQTLLTTAKVIAARAIAISTAMARDLRVGPAHSTPSAGTRRRGSSSRVVDRRARQRVFLAMPIASSRLPRPTVGVARSS